MSHATPDLTLAEARAIIDRAVGKARELCQAGAFVVMDAAGNVVSISVMEGAQTSSVWVSRAKAYVSAVQREPSARRAANWHDNMVGFLAYQHLMHDEIFAGPGAMPIVKDGQVVGSVSTGGGLGPATEITGLDPSVLMAGDVNANAEDLIISVALGAPYQNQHPNVERLVGHPVKVTSDDRPRTLAVSRGYADRAVEAAHARGLRVGVAVVDELSQLVQMDRMDWAAPSAPDLAEALARTALDFQRPTSTLAAHFAAAHLAEIQAIARYKMLTLGGGVPIVRDGIVVGGLGVSGSGDWVADETVARTALGH